MFSLPVRIVVVLVATTYGMYCLIYGNQSGYLFLAAALLLFLGYFRYGSIRPAVNAMGRGEIDVARKHIDTIKFPKFLSAKSRAYWHWVKGVVAAQDANNLPYAEEQLRLAIGGALRTSNDRCIATATLAQIVAENNDLEAALQILADVEQIPHRDSASVYLAKLRSEFEYAG